MTKLTKVKKGLTKCSGTTSCDACPYNTGEYDNCINALMIETLEVLDEIGGKK